MNINKTKMITEIYWVTGEMGSEYVSSGRIQENLVKQS